MNIAKWAKLPRSGMNFLKRMDHLNHDQNQKLSEVVSALHYIAQQQHEQMMLTREMIVKLSQSLGVEIPAISPTLAGGLDFQGPPGQNGSFRQAMARIPLMLDEKTYNTAHPSYDANAVRNHPGKIFNHKKRTKNILFKAIQKLAKGDTVPDKAWDTILDEMLAEAKTVPGADQVFERKAYIEQYMADLGKKYGGHYVPGWVNLEDALFLYWVVRTFKPKTIVQTGVCNGLSSAFMMLALAKNGAEGKLHVVDLAAVFNPNDPDWTVKDKVYGVVIPEGKSSGWMVPDLYKDRFFVQNGDAKELLPKLIDSLPQLDMFYHDSDHTYNHMMFEFETAKRKLTPGGLILGDDISWNASVWDFADKYEVPSYNYKGAVGVAFF